MAAPTASPSSSKLSVLPEGTIPVGLGLLIAGLSAYGFLALAGVGLAEAQSKQVAQLWFVTFILAPGFFLPVEQEVGRALAHRRALRQGNRPVVLKSLTLAAGLLVTVMLILAALSGFVTSEIFDGSWALFFCLLLSFAGYAGAHFTRGLLAGTGRFVPYGSFMALEGILRVTAVAIFVALGVTTVGAYGLLVALPPMIAIAVTLPRHRPLTEPGPPAAWGEITPNLGWLVAGSVFAATLLNAGPITANLLAEPSQDDLVRDFGFAVLIARVPLFMFQAVQAALLPRLARLAARQQYDDFNRGLRKLLSAVALIGFVGVTGAFLVGPSVLELVFQADMTRRTLTLLALGSAIYMFALGLAQAVIALHGHAWVALGWVCALAGFVVVVLIGDDLLLRVEMGLVTGSLVALGVFSVALRERMRAGAIPDEGSMYEAYVDSPVEP